MRLSIALLVVTGALLFADFVTYSRVITLVEHKCTVDERDFELELERDARRASWFDSLKTSGTRDSLRGQWQPGYV